MATIPGAPSGAPSYTPAAPVTVPTEVDSAELACPTPEALDALKGTMAEKTAGYAKLWAEWIEKGLSITPWYNAPSDVTDTTSMVRKARNILVYTEDCATGKDPQREEDLQVRTLETLAKQRPLLDNPVSVADHFERSWPLVRSVLSLSRQAREAVKNLALTGLAAIKILKDPKEFAAMRVESQKVGPTPDLNAPREAGKYEEFNAWRMKSNGFHDFMQQRFGVSEALEGIPGVLFRRALAAKDEAGRQAILSAYEKITIRVLNDLQ